MDPTRAPLTFVTVVFEAEIALLRLQARSMRAHLDAGCVAEIIVLDNCAAGMPAASRHAIRQSLGDRLGQRVTFLRTSQLGVVGGAQGWRSQQAAKLLVARRITTVHYVILDAKNHLVRDADAASFVDEAGRARGGTHSYAAHPLRSDLARTLVYLGADQRQVALATVDFPPTATPFVMTTALACRMLDDVERRSGVAFGEEFERAGLLEFFLYSGWSLLREGTLPVTGDAILAPIIWPAHATHAGATAAIREARDSEAAWFAVHRRVLWRADLRTRRTIEAFWHESGLMSRREAARFVRGFRLRYLPAMAIARLAERWSAVRHRR